MLNKFMEKDLHNLTYSNLIARQPKNWVIGVKKKNLGWENVLDYYVPLKMYTKAVFEDQYCLKFILMDLITQ